MPLQDILNVPAPPRHFRRPINKWFFLLASRLSVIPLGVVIAALLSLPYVFYADAQHTNIVRQLRPTTADIKFLGEQSYQKSGGNRKGSITYIVYDYELLYVSSTGDSIKKTLSSERRLGCLRSPLNDAEKIGCIAKDTILYSGAPAHKVALDYPPSRPIFVLIVLVPALIISAVLIGVGIQKRRRQLALLLTGLVAEAKTIGEKTAEKGSTIREYEYTSFDGKQHRINQVLDKKKSARLPETVPVLYSVSDQKNAMICHASSTELHLPTINSDGSIEGFRIEIWAMLGATIFSALGLTIYLAATWGAF